MFSSADEVALLLWKLRLLRGSPYSKLMAGSVAESEVWRLGALLVDCEGVVV